MTTRRQESDLDLGKPWMPSHQLFVEDSVIFLIVQ